MIGRNGRGGGRAAAPQPVDDDAPQTAEEHVGGLRGRVVRTLEGRGSYQRWVLLSALAGMFATSFPITILVVSLGDIALAFDTSETTLAWVLSAPLLASAVALPVLGRMGDLYGHRRVFLAGFALSTVTAAVTALAWNPLSLIGLRTLTQVIGAATMPTSMALIMSVFRPHERVKAMGYWSLVGAGAPAIGLVVGGPLVEAVGWRMVFVLQASLGLVALLVSSLVLKETVRQERVPFDVMGAATLALGVGSAMFALNQSIDWGWSSPAVIGPALVAPVGLLAFVRVERRTDHPLLPLDFFRRRNFTAPAANSFFCDAAYMGAFMLAPLLLRFDFGYSLSATAFFMLLRPLSFSVFSPVGGALASRIGERASAVLGDAIFVAAMVQFALGAWLHSIELVSSALVFQGLGNGLSRPSITASMANSVDESDFGIVAASQRLVQQVGAAVGITLLTVAYGGVNETGPFTRAFALGALLAIGSLVTATFVQSVDRRAEQPEPALEPTAA